MMRTSRVLRAGLLLLTFAAASTDAGEIYKTQGIEGEGRTKQAAINDALTKGLGKILDKAYPGYASKSKKYLWTRRVILALPEMVVTDDYDLLGEVTPLKNRGGAGWRVTVAIRLPVQSLNEAWAESEALVNWVGRPTVAVDIIDQIEDNRRPAPWFSELSVVEQQFREVLQANGFEVKVGGHVDVLKTNHSAFALRDYVDENAILELRSRHSADLYLQGIGRAIGPVGHNRTPGRREWDWETYAQAKIYWTDDATLLATLDEQSLGSDNDPNAGVVYGLRNVGDILAEAFIEKVFEEWSRWAFEGRPVTFTITRGTFTNIIAIREALESASDALTIEDTIGGNGVFEIRLLTKLSGFEVGMIVKALEFEGFELNELETRQRTVRAVVNN